MRLTDASVRALQPPQKGQKVYRDDTLPGFAVRVSQGGAKTFILIDGRERRFTTIGRYPFISLKNARTAVLELKAERTLNRHRPKRLRFKEALETFVSEKRGKNRARTIDENERILTKYYGKLHQKHLEDIRTDDITDILDGLAKTPGTQLHAFWSMRVFMRWCVKRRYLQHNPIEGLDPPAPTNRRERVLTDDELRTIWRALDETPQPFSDIVRLLLLTGARRGEIAALRREWILFDHHMIGTAQSAIPDRISSRGSSNGSSTSTTEQCALGAGSETQKGLLLSAPYKAQNDDGSRPSVSSSQSAENTDCELTRGERREKCAAQGHPSRQCVITIPKEIAKNRRVHSFPIGALTVKLLTPLIRENDGLLFSAHRNTKPFSGWSKSKSQLDKKVTDILAENNFRGRGSENGPNKQNSDADVKSRIRPMLNPWTLHDLRRTAATNWQKHCDASTEDVEFLLGHISGVRSGLIGTYQRWDRWPRLVEIVNRYDSWFRQHIAHT